MSEKRLHLLVQFFKGLADASRLRILGLLAAREHSVEELAAILGLKEPTVSHHLGKLKELGLVRMTQAGNVHLYALDEAGLRALSQDVLTPQAMEQLVDDLDAGGFERKVLQTFFTPDGQLRDIPVPQKKRLVVLQRLAAEFTPGQRYHETEVNAVLKRFHPDVATLRREFIMNKLMQRDHGYYWRAGE